MRLVLPIGLTLENFSPFSNMCKELLGYGPIEGKYPFLSMSVDDLLVLRRLLPSTGALFHYLTVRQAVAGIPGAQLFDEIDHLGAYISQNRMDQTMAEQLAKADVVWWDQFSAQIDEYFGDPDWERKPIPEQKIPETMRELLDALDRQRPTGFLKLSGMLRDLSSLGRADLEKVLAHLKQRGRQRPAIGMLAGDAASIQFWGLPEIRLATSPEVVRRAQVGCLAAKKASIMTLFFAMDTRGHFGRLSLRTTRAPSPIQADYPAMLAEAREMDGRRFELGQRKGKGKRDPS